MSTNPGKIRVANLMIDTVKKDIRNIHLGVYPPNGRVRVATPLKTSDETIRLFVISKMHWIKKQRQKFIQQERQTQRQYVSGESHNVLGRRYRLNVIETNDRPRIEIRRSTRLDLHVLPDMTAQAREAVFDKFYRSELREVIPSMLERWQKKLEVNVDEIRIRKMKTKWGTCNPAEGRIWLNLELAKKPSHCIDYVFVHELVHLIEKKHSERFMQLLESFFPNWERAKIELNRAALGYSKWDC